MSGGRNTFAVKVDTSGLNEYLNQLGDAAEEAVQPAAKAMAEVYVSAVRALVPVSKAAHFFYGSSFKTTGVRYGPYSPGHLQRSIYWAYSPERSGKGFATYAVGYNYRKAPYAHMVEFGTEHSKGVGFMSRTAASEAVEREAYEAGEKVLLDALAKVGE